MEAAWAPLATVIVAILGGIGSYFITRRKTGGTVKTSDAAQLWAANTEFRQMLLTEAKERTQENANLRKEMAECDEERTLLEGRVATMEREISRLKKVVGDGGT